MNYITAHTEIEIAMTKGKYGVPNYRINTASSDRKETFRNVPNMFIYNQLNLRHVLQQINKKIKFEVPNDNNKD